MRWRLPWLCSLVLLVLLLSGSGAEKTTCTLQNVLFYATRCNEDLGLMWGDLSKGTTDITQVSASIVNKSGEFVVLMKPGGTTRDAIRSCTGFQKESLSFDRNARLLRIDKPESKASAISCIEGRGLIKGYQFFTPFGSLELRPDPEIEGAAKWDTVLVVGYNNRVVLSKDPLCKPFPNKVCLGSKERILSALSVPDSSFLARTTAQMVALHGRAGVEQSNEGIELSANEGLAFFSPKADSMEEAVLRSGLLLTESGEAELMFAPTWNLPEGTEPVLNQSEFLELLEGRGRLAEGTFTFAPLTSMLAQMGTVTANDWVYDGRCLRREPGIRCRVFFEDSEKVLGEGIAQDVLEIYRKSRGEGL